MHKDHDEELKELRRKAFPTLSEEEREEAARLLREYLAVCAHIYEEAKRNGTWPWPHDDDSTNSDS